MLSQKSYKIELEHRQRNKKLGVSAIPAYDENSVDCAKVGEIKFKDPHTDRKLSIINMMEEVSQNSLENGNFHMRIYRKYQFVAFLNDQDTNAKTICIIFLAKTFGVKRCCL